MKRKLFLFLLVGLAFSMAGLQPAQAINFDLDYVYDGTAPEAINPDLPWDELAMRFGDGSWNYIVKVDVRTINGKRRVVVFFPATHEFLVQRSHLLREWEDEENPGDFVMDRGSEDLYARKHYPAEFVSEPEFGHKMYNCSLTFDNKPCKESEKIQALRSQLIEKEKTVRNLQSELDALKEKGLHLTDDQI